MNKKVKAVVISSVALVSALGIAVGVFFSTFPILFSTVSISAKINSKLIMDVKKNHIVENAEWLDMVEFTIPYIEKAIPINCLIAFNVLL